MKRQHSPRPAKDPKARTAEQTASVAMRAPLALSERDVQDGRVRPASDVFADLRRRRSTPPSDLA